MAFWSGIGFTTATVIAISVFLLGDAWGHIQQMMETGNFAPGNAGLVFYMDIAMPVVSIILLLLVRARKAGPRQRRMEPSSSYGSS